VDQVSLETRRDNASKTKISAGITSAAPIGERSRTGSRDDLGKIGTEQRGRLLMINARKERHGSVEVAKPDLGGAGVKIEGAFFVDLGWGVRWRKDFDADLWGACKEERLLGNLGPIGSEPCDIDSLDTVGGGDWALRKNEALREQLRQKTANGKLTARVAESWRRTHEDASEAIGLDPVREPGELGVSQDLGPAIQVEPGLRCKVR
jgi:hypothetical protein